MYDLVVIGAGPAGSAAAYYATRAGLNVLLTDRRPFPRAKICGDALSPRALAAARRMGLNDLTGHPVRGTRIIDLGSRMNTFEDFSTHVAPHEGLVICRETLDHLLLEQVRDAGAEFRVAAAREPIYCNGHIEGLRLETEGGPWEVRTKAVVAATGSETAARLLGTAGPPRGRSWGVAGTTYLRINTPPGNDLEIYFPIRNQRRLLAGYGWVFPVGPDRINVGVGIFSAGGRTTPSVSKLVERFIAQRRRLDPRFRGAECSSPIRTAPIPVGPFVSSTPGLLAAGDLAGLANPFTGEGIGFALESGELAARAVATTPNEATEQYAESLRLSYPRHFALRRALAGMYARPWPLLGRGADLLFAGGHSTTEALRRLVWDDPGSVPSWKDCRLESIRTTIEQIRHDIVSSTGRLRPLLGELAAYVVDDPRVGFGWCAALAAAMQYGLAPTHLGLSDSARRVVVVLETLNLITHLHRDLPISSPPAMGERIWGRNTLGIVLADVFTARALRLIYTLDDSWRAFLGGVARRSLREETHHSGGENRRSYHLLAARNDTFTAAALAGTPDGTRHELPLVAQAVVGALASFRSGSKVLPRARERELRDQLAKADSSLRRSLTEVLEISSASGPPRGTCS